MNSENHDPGARMGRRQRHELRLRLATVLRVQALGPAMRRVTLGGESLLGFTSAAPDDHVKVFFPLRPGEPPGLPGGVTASAAAASGGAATSGGPPGRSQGGSPGVAAAAGSAAADASDRPIARDYTPRRYDAGRCELDIDFVLHGEGPAAAWAAQAAPGQQLGVGGPRGSFIIPDDLDWYLMMGDETALPAIGRWLEQLPATAQAIVITEVAGSADEMQFRSAASLQLQWLRRGDAVPGDVSLMLQAARAQTLPAGSGYIWIAGESHVSRALREHFVGERGFDRRWIKAAGYWKQGVAATHETHD